MIVLSEKEIRIIKVFKIKIAIIIVIIEIIKEINKKIIIKRKMIIKSLKRIIINSLINLLVRKL